MVRGLWGTVLAISVLALGCSGDDDDDDVIVFADAGPDAAVDAAPPGDDNDSFGEADPVDVDDPGRSGTIGTPGDQDYYVFEATAGQWLEIAALPDDFESELFPIVTLFDASMVQVAEGYVLATHIPTAGTYYVKVEDFTSLLGDPMPYFDPDEPYTLDLVELADGVNGYYFDAEDGDDAASARVVPMAPSFFFINLLGLFDHAADRDVYSITLPGSGTQYFSASTSFPGPQGNGSTSDFAAMWITDTAGAEILARIDPTAFDLNPPLPAPATYLLWIEKDAAAPGANDFYEISLFGGFEDDPLELETLATPGTNDTIALADASGEDVLLSTSFSGFIAYLPPGDVDYIGFDATDAVSIRGLCQAQSAGSGLLGMTAEIRDATDNVLVSSTEPDSSLLEVSLPAAGRYYYRLSAAGQDPEVTGNWVRCFMRIPTF